MSLYRAERLSLWLEPSGELKVINSSATATARGAVITQAADLQRALSGEHLGTLAEAILWHGGEAQAARDAFRAAARADRDALIAFLSTL